MPRHYIIQKLSKFHEYIDDVAQRSKLQQPITIHQAMFSILKQTCGGNKALTLIFGPDQKKKKTKNLRTSSLRISYQSFHSPSFSLEKSSLTRQWWAFNNEEEEEEEKE